MLAMKESEATAKLPQYEGLVVSTAAYWRDSITPDLAIEDIRQVLRLKVWQALKAYDPNHPRAMPEKAHVFGAVRNQIKDLQRKKHRKEEWLTDGLPGEWMKDGKVPLKRELANFDHTVSESMDFLRSLPVDERRVACLLIEGYKPKDIQIFLSITPAQYKETVEEIRIRIDVSLPELVRQVS